MPSRLQAEIKQTKPFPRRSSEALLSVMRTAALLEHRINEILRPYGITELQYNVLRILRGAGSHGLACQEIAERMINRDPDITRLLDRLEARKLIERARSDLARGDESP